MLLILLTTLLFYLFVLAIIDHINGVCEVGVPIILFIAFVILSVFTYWEISIGSKPIKPIEKCYTKEVIYKVVDDKLIPIDTVLLNFKN